MQALTMILGARHEHSMDSWKNNLIILSINNAGGVWHSIIRLVSGIESFTIFTLSLHRSWYPHQSAHRWVLLYTLCRKLGVNYCCINPYWNHCLEFRRYSYLLKPAMIYMADILLSESLWNVDATNTRWFY